MTTPTGSEFEPRVIAPQGFRLRRANATMTGFTPAVDSFVEDRLDELDALLKKRIIPKGPRTRDVLVELLKSPLTARRASSGVGKWADGSLADRLRDQQPNPAEQTMHEVIDEDPALARMRYRFDESLDARRTGLDINARTVLDRASVRDLLVLQASLILGITSQSALLNFVFTNPTGVPQIIRYAVVSAARDHIQDKRLRVRGIDEDNSEVVAALAKLSLSEESLGTASIATATSFIESSKYDELIEEGTKLKITDIPAEIRPRLVQYIKESTVEVTKQNAPFILPMYLAKAATTSTTSSGGTTDDPFAVSFFVEDSASLQVSTAAVKCAAQLYYVMVLGEELGVFDAVRYFTHRYLFREGFAVEDPRLRRDLENYVFSEQFPGLDRETGQDRNMRCTRDGERRSFYRQVFNHGTEPVPGEGLPNTEFGRLWKILMLESARYLERAQASPNPDNYVSRQNVMQAVEDLQYNLSVTCVGMATVMTPLMYAELDFVVNRILGHEEVRKHLVPSGGSWWKVVEKLQAGQGRRGRASVLHNKARLGYSLLREIAEYTPSRFEEDGPFSAFISNIDAFITTQSILQEEAESSPGTAENGDSSSYDDGYGDDSNGNGHANGNGRPPGMPDVTKLPGMPNIPGVNAPWPGSSNGSSHAGMNGTPVPARASDGAGDEWDF
ncbi:MULTISPECIES: hypothetical protein [unclassified Mycobacterium]|uniref:hypothetical protein n=1 Tax=unclassified Mycobacterium TaxID=2642494 RepID=UPI00048BE011|nr:MULTISPECIES: hypothetical protein [unclassified Mycobacterium]SEA04147.1 hypothetical protein SAMN04488580_101549 [Mycobacterium sp. 283mftsu]